MILDLVRIGPGSAFRGGHPGADFEILFGRIPLVQSEHGAMNDQRTRRRSALTAFLMCAGRAEGIPRAKLTGTHPERHPQGGVVIPRFAPGPGSGAGSLRCRLISTNHRVCAARCPEISTRLSGGRGHFRDRLGPTAGQAIWRFTLADASPYWRHRGCNAPG